MKKSIISYALLLGLSPFLVQCVASEQELRGVDLRTRTLDNRVAELERLNETVRAQAAAQARLGNDLGGISSRLLQQEGRMDEADHQRRRLQEQQAEGQRTISIRLDNIDINLKEIAGRLEEMNRQFTASLAEVEKQQQENSRQIQEIQQQRAREAAERAAAAATAARAAEQARREAEERARRETAERERAQPRVAPGSGPREIAPERVKQKVEEGRPPAAIAPAPRPTEAPTTAGPGHNLYELGRKNFQDKKYPDAYAALARYLEQNPRGEMAADARFLLGESLFNQQEFELAILEYQKVIADFPGHARIPEALFRQGRAFEELREPTTAVVIYERLAGEFPRSSQAEKARERLQKIR